MPRFLRSVEAYTSPKPHSPGVSLTNCSSPTASQLRLEAGASFSEKSSKRGRRFVESGEVAVNESTPTAWLRHQMSTDICNASDDETKHWENLGASDGDGQFALWESALTFKDVSFSVRHRGPSGAREDISVLAPTSGHFAPGTLAAIMGPSGSGKTTLVDILANKKTSRYTGQIHFNGRPRDQLFARMTAYVPQHDVMPAYQTVKEAVLFQAALKKEWPPGYTKEMANKHTDRRLKLLGLYGVRDSLIGDDHVRGISGGQRRRLSLARGIASGARLLFCDEPTSGLSATDADSCVRYMRLLADRLCLTIVVVIHQPRIEVAELFDTLLLLTSFPGRVVYNGPMAAATSHFEQVVGKPMPARINPMDYCMDLVTPGTRGSCEEACVRYYDAHCRPEVEKLVDSQLVNKRSTSLEMLEAWREGMLRHGYIRPIRNSKYGVRCRRQCWLVFQRLCTLSFRDRQGVLADFSVAAFRAVVVGVAYMRVGTLNPSQQCGFFFMVLMTCSIEGMKNMPKIIGDRTIMKMEVSEALYSEWAYIFAFTIINWAQTIVCQAIYVVILFCMSGLSWSLFWSVCLWTTFLSVTMDSLYLMIAAIAKDSSSAFVLSLPFLMLFLLYNGYTATKTTVPDFMQWAIRISPVAYAMEAIVIAASKVYDDDMYPVLLERFGYVDEPETALEVMTACFLLFRVIQMVCLRKFNNVER